MSGPVPSGGRPGDHGARSGRPAPVRGERYARHELIPGWDQSRLGAATIVVVGVGAVGSEAARLLAQSGVGRLVLCDPDVVSESNLSRGALFAAKDVGSPKATVAAAALAEIAPEVSTEARVAELGSGVGLAELRAATVVLSCLDSRAARLRLATRCTPVGAAMLDGGTHPWGGEVRLFPAGGRCFGCGMSDRERAVRDDPWSCGALATARTHGASGPVSALIGSWLAVVTLRLAIGLPAPPGTLRVETADGTVYRLDEPADPDCPLHDRIPPDAVTPAPGLTVESTVADLLARLDPDETALSWVDFPRVAGRAATTIQFRDAEPRRTLRELGVAPGELIPVARTGRHRGMRYIELAPTRQGGDP
jgi:molybdopterin/thiamine biosynthesis adenylyltransferase